MTGLLIIAWGYSLFRAARTQIPFRVSRKFRAKLRQMHPNPAPNPVFRNTTQITQKFRDFNPGPKTFRKNKNSRGIVNIIGYKTPMGFTFHVCINNIYTPSQIPRRDPNPAPNPAFRNSPNHAKVSRNKEARGATQIPPQIPCFARLPKSRKKFRETENNPNRGSHRPSSSVTCSCL